MIAFALYGPVITFDDLSTDGFPGHGRRDAFAAVSLDDGSTWKRTNLSNSADRSSFVLPDDAAIPDPAFAQAEFVVTAPNPVITTATYAAKTKTLTVSGTGAASKAKVEIRNALTFDVIGTTTAKPNGSFTFTAKKLATVPCNVQAGASSSSTWGPYLAVAGAPADCVGSGSVTMTTDYPGDVVNGMHAMHGNKILAAWQSKFCSAGSPAWGDEFIASDQATVATYLRINIASDLYLTDVFGVAGSQGSTDYREQEEYPGEYDAVGVVPHSCLWTARGLVRENPDELGKTEVVWFQAERLTSGRRDVNRIEVGCVAGAGCAVSWQEDPEGLRPGEGEGPGTGWSGATTASKTDVWFSFIRWDDFEVVDNNGDADGDDLVPLADLSLDLLGTSRPKPGVPMMVPVRLSNNDRCLGDTPESAVPPIYCTSAAAAYGLKPQCIISITTANTGAFACVADTNSDGVGDLPNIANTAASRPRLSLQPRDGDSDGITDDAWVMVFAEEDKGLGAFGFPNNFAWDGNLASTAANCGDPDSSKTDVCIEADIGKNILWYTFAMGTANTSAALEDDFSLVNNLVFQGAQLNQPEVNWHTGTFFPPMSTADMWGFGEELDYLIFNTEIARRSSMMAQSIAKAKASNSKLVAMPLWKQGTMNQGGPADIMARRFEATTIEEANANPYDVANMKCEWYAEDGTATQGVILFDPDTDYNPYYPKGLCTAPAINLSGRTPNECESSGAASDGTCNTENLTCKDTVYGQLCVPATVTDGSADDPLYLPALDKMLSWYECPGANGAYTGTRNDLPACGVAPASTILESNLDDQSWYNPVDIAKGHRGFLDGDFVQMLYAWSPNYKQNTVGNDRYDLYVRRSFDGGITWTTTPASFTASDGKPYVGAGTVTCETLRDGADSQTDNHICTTYDAGVAEQSRNVSQLQSMKYTILDPRYTPTGTNLGVGMPDATPAWATGLDWLLFTPVEPTDIRNPSRFFVVYETGDNTTTAVGEAEPLDLFYGRAEVFGDHYTVWAEVDTDGTIDECYPNNPHEIPDLDWAVGFCNEFDDLEGKQDSESGEASLTASAYGDFLYAVWAQENFAEDPETGEHEFVDSDAMFRRVWYLDDYVSDTEGWSLPGANQ
ncbi:MAG: hypothetical protein KAX51_01530 [Chromatiaceae bacterium]|nr:hypothetical protein [Chromatiaceae bacterium]MBP8288496.1 hypothetical protein [Chromatiaceae bacterium]